MEQRRDDRKRGVFVGASLQPRGSSLGTVSILDADGPMSTGCLAENDGNTRGTERLLDLTRTQFNNEDVVLPVDAETAYVYLVRAFRNAGTIQVEKAEFKTVYAKIAGGLVRRADLTGRIEPIDSSSCRLVLTSVAQEDMSSPGAGARALAWLLNEIRVPLLKLAEVQPRGCKKCSQLNPLGSRYCGTCGTPLYVPRIQ